MAEPSTADLLVRCLENEDVEYVFGIPGEENIRFVDALSGSRVRYVLVRHEQAAAFMADIYGRLTGKAGVCSATLGPGAINLQLGVADATTNSAPLVAISAQVGLNRIYKETHQTVDLVTLFDPITKWAQLVPSPDAVPEMVRKAFKLAQTERPGAVYLAVPEDVEAATVTDDSLPLPINVVRRAESSPNQVARAAEVLAAARCPIVLAGHGATRAGASRALVEFSERLGVGVATTFNGKGVFPDDHPNALGAFGFMRHDLVNFGFDVADVIIAVGYELQEFDPAKMNPNGDKKILHLHQFPAEVDAHYHVEVGMHGDIAHSLHALAESVSARWEPGALDQKIRLLLAEELDRGREAEGYPLLPQRVIADVREAMDRADIALCDTGAVKMWMARMYPAYQPNTCLFSNGLSTMGFSLPGAMAAKLVHPERRVLAVTGDGAFLMHCQELETAVREGIPIVILIWEDNSYGLIKWKMDLELGRHSHVDFGNPDFVALAESFGAKGYRIAAAAELLPTLRVALNDDAVSVISCPVDYAENLRLTDRLGDLTGAL
ncbi:MAG: acetolactate synthase large subunit [Sciscionella sp.]